MVTEKRFIRFFEKKGFFGPGKSDSWELAWNDVVSISDPIPIWNGAKVVFATFEGNENKIAVLPNIGAEIVRESRIALSNSIHQKTDMRAKLLNSPIP